MRLTTLTSHAESGARVCAIALGFSIPISVALDNILLGLILLLWLASGGYRDKFTRVSHNPVAIACVILFALLAAGIAYGQASVSEGVSSLGKYLDLAFVPVFATLFRHERERRFAWHAVGLALGLTVVVSYLILFGIVANTPFTLGNAANPEVFKHYLTQSVFLAFGAYLFVELAGQARGKSERAIWIAFALLAALNVLVLTQGRTGQLILLALALHFGYTKWRWKGVAGTATLAVLLLGSLAMLNSGSRLATTPGEMHDWSSAKAAAPSSSTGLRLEFYRNSLDIALAHPWLGTGTGSFARTYAEHVAGTAMTPTVNPHDEYLNIAIQVGIAGLLAMLYIFYIEWRLAAGLPMSYERQLARALVITFAIGCAFNSLLMDHAEGLFFAWASGLLFAGLRSTEKLGGAAG